MWCLFLSLSHSNSLAVSLKSQMHTQAHIFGGCFSRLAKSLERGMEKRGGGLARGGGFIYRLCNVCDKLVPAQTQNSPVERALFIWSDAGIEARTQIGEV